MLILPAATPNYWEIGVSGVNAPASCPWSNFGNLGICSIYFSIEPDATQMKAATSWYIYLLTFITSCLISAAPSSCFLGHLQFKVRASRSLSQAPLSREHKLRQVSLLRASEQGSVQKLVAHRIWPMSPWIAVSCELHPPFCTALQYA